MSWGFVLPQPGRAPRRVTNVRDDKARASGFWRDTDRRDGNAYVMGRPAGLAVARDGALLDALTAGWFLHQQEVAR